MPALVFDLDGTLVDTVYAHVFAWQRTFAELGRPIDAWKIHRRMGMSGGLFARAAAREIGQPLGEDEFVGLLSGGYGYDELLQAGAFCVYHDAEELRVSLDELGIVL